ncbi:MAG: ATP-binding protein [Pirellulales bacterium]
MTDVTLQNCDQEPIRIPGLIQPHGILVVARKSTLEIRRISANVADLLGISPADLIGRELDSLCAASEDARRFDVLKRELTTSKPVYLHTTRLLNSGGPWDAIAHSQGENVVVEFEPSENISGVDAADLDRRIQASLVRMEEARTVAEMYEICAEQVRNLTGFDRVMVYRFDRDWNGEVVAERKRDALEPFFGLHYPASDIPKQARELYTINWLRFITNRDYRPAALVPASGPASHEPLDLSHAVLRSVSPIHLEYLRNMGVSASMSLSLLRGGKLWGLIACHHYSPRYVPYPVRKVCELLCHFMSLQFVHAEDREFEQERSRKKDIRRRLVENLEATEDPVTSLVGSSTTILDLVSCGGAAIVSNGLVHRIGHTPPEQTLAEMAKWLTAQGEEVYATEELREKFGTGTLSTLAAGMLGIVIGQTPSLVVMWFRPEQVRTVEWAGNPEKATEGAEETLRLSPRGSFALWRETVRGKSSPWSDEELRIVREFRTGVVRLMMRRAEELAASADGLRLANAEREKALESERAARAEAERLNRMKDEFVATLSHELRTPLNAILGWTQLLRMQGSPNAVEMSEGLDVIERNARSQAVMIEDLMEISRIVSGKIRLDLQVVDLAGIIQSAVDSVAPTAQTKGVKLEVVIDPLRGAQTTADPNRIKQIAWNLLTNAVKFTAKGGKVLVIVRRVASHIEFSVTDSGIGIAAEFLPHVFDRYRQADGSITRSQGGLGLGLAIVRNLVELHGGSVSAYSAGEGKGATFVVTLPFSPVGVVSDEKPQLDSQEQSADFKRMLNGIQVLIVDDEFDSREMLRRLLSDVGCVVVQADSARAALDLRESQAFDILVSDIGMPSTDGYEFIRLWRKAEASSGVRKIPAIALTAYARSEDRRKSLLSGFQAHLTKPVEAAELLTTMSSLADRLG